MSLYQLPGQDWVVHRRYERDDLPDTLQVGLVTYSDWTKVNDFGHFFHNSNALEPGIQPDPTPGEPFNPELHQALMMQPSDEHPPQTVLSEAARGYVLRGRTIRPAGVVVAVAPEEQSEGDGDA